MKIGLISDIHGNVLALDAVLAALEVQRLDALICLGDLAGMGPRPREVVQRVRALGCPAVQGNWDEWMVAVRAGTRAYGACLPIDRWSAEQLDASELAYLAALPMTLEVPLDESATLLCFHGTPQSRVGRVEPHDTRQQLSALQPGWPRAEVFACGHTHEQVLRRLGNGYVLNPGSVSQCWDLSAEQEQQPFSPWAEYAVLEWTGGMPLVRFGRVALDVAAIIDDAFSVGMAGVEEWAARWRRF